MATWSAALADEAPRSTIRIICYPSFRTDVCQNMKIFQIKPIYESVEAQEASVALSRSDK